MTDDNVRSFASSSALGPAPGIEALDDWDSDRSEWRRHQNGFRHWLVVQVIGGRLPPWIRAEQELPTSAVWHLTVVHDAQESTASHSDHKSLCESKWRILLLPTSTNVDSLHCDISHAHLILRCEPEQIDHIAEDLSHFILRHSYMGVSTNDVITPAGLCENVAIYGMACVLPGLGAPAARLLVPTLAKSGLERGSGKLMICGVFTAPDSPLTLLDVDETLATLQRESLADEMIVKGLFNSPRCEILIVLL